MGVAVKLPPVIQYDNCAANNAYRLHQALGEALRNNPLLSDDPLFRDFQERAYARFEQAFEVLK